MAKEVISPSLPPLSPVGKQKLIMKADEYAKTHKENVLHYLETGEVSLAELPLLDRVPEIKQWLVEEYNAWRFPADPAEKVARAALQALMPETPMIVEDLPADKRAELETALRSYLGLYSDSLPSGNIVEEAGKYLKAIQNIEIRARERQEWEQVDFLSYNALMNYLRTHPETPFFNELDNHLWDLVKVYPIDIHMIHQFLRDVPRSSHASEAMAIDAEYRAWEELKAKENLEELLAYKRENPAGAFVDEATVLIGELKRKKIAEIKLNPARYSKFDLDEWLRSGIFSTAELIREEVVTEESLETLRTVSEIERDVVQSKVHYDCPSGYTDVYFLGIPSTGKTCVLMGLLSSMDNHFIWDSVSYGGEYGCDLKKLCGFGVTPSRTTGDFATVITGSIKDYDKEGVIHKVNLIEMAGEAFAERIARNPEANVTISDLGPGIPQMLANDNQKVFFIVIDPTTKIAKYRKEVVYEDGRKDFLEVSVPQEITMHKFMSILRAPENEAIMRKVRGVYVIATKADCLGAREVREEKAVSIVGGQYGQSVNILRDICHPDKYDINALTDNQPRVFPFSLGTFYLGGVFKYDSTDSDTIIKLISKLASGEAGHKKWHHRLRDWFNS